MPSRVPLDVDLEDRLLFGLTPTRLVYLVVAMLAGFSTWSARWAPIPLRAVSATALLILGALAAWGRWRGRPVDAWVIDVVLFVKAVYRLRWKLPHSKRPRLRLRPRR
jgi:hypothetical protein